MISGREALGSIDQTIGQARDQIATLQHEITEVTESLLAARKAQTDDYLALARVRVEQLADGPDVVEHVSETRHQVIALLARRDAAYDELRGRIANLVDAIRHLEARRTAQASVLDDAVAEVDQAEALLQAHLDQAPAYRAQRERAEVAERQAMHAQDKAERSAREREHKGEDYRNDPLFTYLWERDYGESGYAARGLTRWLDGKVARLIGYADARANYARLNEIPQRLAEHAGHLRELADAEFERLRELDEEARIADGVPALEQGVATEQANLDVIDEELAASTAQRQGLAREQTAFDSGRDEHTQAAIDYLANEYRREDLVALREQAIRTPYPEDDLVIARMLNREDEQARVEASIQGLREAIDQQQVRLLELESLRADFKRNRYDRSGSVFSNDSIIPVLLGQFLAGMLDRGMLWKVLREQQHYSPNHSDPGFGSGGFGRGTVWKGGLGDLGDIIGGLGRGGFGGGRGGGGGFRSGGGF